ELAAGAAVAQASGALLGRLQAELLGVEAPCALEILGGQPRGDGGIGEGGSGGVHTRRLYTMAYMRPRARARLIAPPRRAYHDCARWRKTGTAPALPQPGALPVGHPRRS